MLVHVSLTHPHGEAQGKLCLALLGCHKIILRVREHEHIAIMLAHIVIGSFGAAHPLVALLDLGCRALCG